MAIIFELVVNFGRDEAAVAAATDELDRHPTVEVRGVRLPLTPPYVTTLHLSEALSYIEFSVNPRGISAPCRGPNPPFKAQELSNDELTSVGDQLYERLRRFHGYEAALVGWDPESLVDVGWLESDYVPDRSLSRVEGLVLSERLIESWGQPEGFAPFEPGFSWIPYRGTRNILRSSVGPPLDA